MYKLRELERKDLPAINAWRNDPELISYLGAPYRYINLLVDEKWFDSYMANRNTTVRCAIVTDTCDDILGLVSLTDIDYFNQSATFHIMVGMDDNRNKGVGSFAVKEMLSHAFWNLHMNRVQLEVLVKNERAIHVYEKAGFVKEGVVRSAVYKNGEFQDMYRYSILRNEFMP